MQGAQECLRESPPPARLTAAWLLGFDGRSYAWQDQEQIDGGVLLRAVCAGYTRVLSSQALPDVLQVDATLGSVEEARKQAGEVLLLGAELIGVALDAGRVDAIRVLLCPPGASAVCSLSLDLAAGSPVLGHGVATMGEAWRAQGSTFRRLGGAWALEAWR